MARPSVPVEVRRRFWRGVREGLCVDEASAAAGVSQASGRRWFGSRGGVLPSCSSTAEPSGLRLSFAEREEIACLVEAGRTAPSIARELGRAPSTITRAARPAAAHADLGPGHRDDQPRQDRRGHRPGHLLPRPALALATRLEREHQRAAAPVLPNGTDLSLWGPGYLDKVAAELNNRPRKTLGWRTPAEALDKLLSNPPDPPGVALTV